MVQELDAAFRLTVNDRANVGLPAAPDGPDDCPPHVLRPGLDALLAAQWSASALRK